jgi:hypothetical protein
MTVEKFQQKRAIVVLGPGRSGTSLLMRILEALGMTLSSSLVKGSVANPEGHFEDKDIMDIHIRLFREIGGHPTMPLPEDWLKHQAIPVVRKTLAEVARNQTDAAPNIWGFKDPRTSAFLPLWFRIFNLEKIIPVFILAIRNPKATIASFVKQYNDSSELAELLWLTRTMDALHHTGGDCFIVHYEDWFSHPMEVSRSLLQYTALDEFCHAENDIEARMQGLVKSNLNRAIYEADDEVRNPYVKILYDALKHCRGSEFDRAELMAVVKECRQAMEGFKGWYMQVHRERAQVAAFKNKLQNKQGQLDAAKEKITTLQTRLQKAERQASRLPSIEAELETATATRTLMREELLRAESQLELIKDLVWGSSQ